MAAELSTLVSSFLDSKPEIYASFFLDCVNSKQHLNTEKIPDGWIGKVNTFLNSKTDSWLGMCLLGITVEQCDSDTFTKNCAPWIRTIVQLIQTSGRPNVIKFCSKLIDDILRYAVEFSELSRELSNSVIPTIVSAVLTKKCADMSCSLSILSSCMHYFPGPSGPLRNQIENFLVPILNSTCEETRTGASQCYALLPRCSRSGSSGKNQMCPWEQQWKKVLNTIHKLLDAAYENVEPVALRPSQESLANSEMLPLGEIPQVEPGRTYTLVTRCNTLLNCLSAMIREDYLKVVTVPIDASIALLTRILSVTSNSLKNAVIVESVLLRASIPLIHANALDLLTNLIIRCGSLMLPYCDLLMKVVVQELTWTKCQDPSYGHDKPFRNLRCSVYLCLEHWVQLTNSLPEGGGVVPKLMQHILDDTKPLISQTKLLPSTNAGNSQMSKKAKKRKLQDDVNQLLTGQQKFDIKANETVTYRALRALSAVLIAVGTDIPQDVLREIQVCIIKLIIQCQQSPYQSYPIPYSSADCRQALYHSLMCCVLTNSPCVPSPVHHAVRLFSGGLQDADLKVSSACREALAVTNSIIHPRSFPQVCSAPGPLLLSTSEHPSTNGPVPEPHPQSISMSHSLSSCDQMTSVNIVSQQSTSGWRTFENGNSMSRSPVHKHTMECGECEKNPMNINSVSTLVNVSNTFNEESQIDTSESHFEKSSDRESGKKSPGNEQEHSEIRNVSNENTYSQVSGIQLSASSSYTPSAHLLNTEGFITANNKKNALQSNNSTTVNQRGEGGISFNQSGEEHGLIETLGESAPKRKKTDDNSNVANEQMHKENRGPPTTGKDHLAERSEEKKAEVTVDSDADETSKMLEAFVDSYPDSDDQEVV